MDPPIPSETPGTLRLDTEARRIMGKIARKTNQLKRTGMLPSDREHLKERLRFAWTDIHNSKETTSVTAWRKKKARKAYTDLQDANNHLFLVVILAVTPTECAIPAFKEVKESLICSKSYENYQLNLDFAEKHFFESMAAEQSFNNNHHYINFINSLFPQGCYKHPFK
jgi:hypothetical protein